MSTVLTRNGLVREVETEKEVADLTELGYEVVSENESENDAGGDPDGAEPKAGGAAQGNGKAAGGKRG